MIFFLYYSILTLIVIDEITIKSRHTIVQNKSTLAHKKTEIISAVYRIVSTTGAL
jgi:hypothetical protein